MDLSFYIKCASDIHPTSSQLTKLISRRFFGDTFIFWVKPQNKIYFGGNEDKKVRTKRGVLLNHLNTFFHHVGV
jgi:hypothetical protein